MFKNYLKAAWRNLMKSRVYGALNIIGLGVGLASCILILIYVQYELSFDRYNNNSDRIFRVTETIKTPTGTNSYATSPSELANLLSNLPQVESAARIVQMSHYLSAYDNVLVSSHMKKFYEQDLFFTDPSIFKTLTIHVLKGSMQDGLSRPYTIFISSSMARKYFGNADPIGKTLIISGSQPYEITGIFRDFPANSHIHAAFFASYESINSHRGNINWGPTVYTYILLKAKTDVATTEKELSKAVKQYIHTSKNEHISFSLMPLLNIHLRSDLRFEAEPQGNIWYISLFSLIALLILCIACFNYINLATARATTRAQETGVRKVIGASRAQLIKQYLLESALSNLIAFSLAIILTGILLPYIDQLTQLPISIRAVCSLRIFIILGVILSLVILLSGLYPALLLSSYQPASTLKGNAHSVSGSGVRKALVVFQFSISTALIVCAMVLRLQMEYVQSHLPGSSKAKVMLINDRASLQKEYQSFKQALLRNPGIENVTTTQFIPGVVHDRISFGMEDIEGFHGIVPSIPVLYGDEDFINTLSLKIISGRNFSVSYPSDKDQSILVNETAVKAFGWKHPIGKYIWFKEPDMSGDSIIFKRHRREVIGIIKDFHYVSLKKKVTPVIIEYADQPLYNIAIRVDKDSIAQTLSYVKKEWKSFVPDKPLDYSFLQEDYISMYRKDYLLGNIFKDLSVLAIIIASIGLFGLAAFSAERRMKEIAVRKVMGASVVSTIHTLSEQFIRPVAVGILIALPIGWWTMHIWLESYAYHISIRWWIFITAIFLPAFIALCTIGFHAMRTALENPVKYLRCE